MIVLLCTVRHQREERCLLEHCRSIWNSPVTAVQTTRLFACQTIQSRLLLMRRARSSLLPSPISVIVNSTPIIRPHPRRTRIRRMSPITRTPCISRTVRIPVAAYPGVPGTGRRNRILIDGSGRRCIHRHGAWGVVRIWGADSDAEEKVGRSKH